LTALGAQRVIAVSPAIEARLRRLGIGRRRLVSGLVVGVELPDLGEARQMRALAREQLGVGPDEQLIMTIGTLKPSKSHELFVRAAAALVERGSEARFVIIGEGPVRPELEEEISRLSLTDRVLLLGERHPAADLLWAADVCVRPGVLEGFVGITVLEAQARGVPVVAFETEDVKAAIENGVSGLLVTPGDVGALADAVRSVLEEHSLAGMLARGGRETVERKFGLRAVTDRLEEMYGSVVEC
jgi:glycosyltransferase involved in cell wall biosynthesis